VTPVFKTSDIVLASYLRLSGFTLTEITKDGNKGTFVFSSVTDEAVNDYDLGNARVEPVAFNNTIRQLTTSVRRIPAA
jgi:hypothetical protein